ncbi:hypothetical protein FJQ98_06870 [Lysinibacillus agricola]|uniref:Potassium transporter n=1 Tax=Lysinibacillus agricola TaxID=2590012 RepID=A0ABX7AVH9_9BACI|nr:MULTISPECIES: hypothetical protein [Lysinibacillus]KOS62791.1 hypothetical protein AN161_10770 [Lysinibacillus sp. FJAT-14222]QQP13765.1 hypothetical protein FJQ98_06870 [Lysinibacillus agricola]
MNKLTSSKKSSIMLLIALIAAILFALYYYLLLPKMNEVESKESNVKQLQQQITSLNGQLAKLDEKQGVPTSNLLTMRQKLPETRAIEKVVLDLAEIEEVSGTRIESMNFNNDDTSVAQSDVPDPNMLEKADAEVNGEQENTEEKSLISSIAKESLPANLKLITFNLEVAALDLKSLESFLKEIEQLERVMKTDAINFTIPGEQDQLEKDADLTLKATVQVTTFYYEGQQ